MMIKVEIKDGVYQDKSSKLFLVEFGSVGPSSELAIRVSGSDDNGNEVERVLHIGDRKQMDMLANLVNCSEHISEL